MKKLLLILAISLFAITCNSKTDVVINDLDTEDWKLTWNDEFNGEGEVDLSKWEKPDFNRKNNNVGPDGWWLPEDSYMDGDGNLVIRAKKINNRNDDNDEFDYSTGAIRSLGKFSQKFGKFEIRCKLPTQPGWWVAFWLFSPTVFNENNSGEDGTEIDIMEGFGWNDTIHHALHWDGYGEAHKSEVTKNDIPGIREGFHTFTLEWNKDEYIWFVDGEESWRSRAGGVSKVPAYVKITAELSTEPGAIGEWWANNPADGNFPDYYIIDYVRVWERKK